MRFPRHLGVLSVLVGNRNRHETFARATPLGAIQKDDRRSVDFALTSKTRRDLSITLQKSRTIQKKFDLPRRLRQ